MIKTERLKTFFARVLGRLLALLPVPFLGVALAKVDVEPLAEALACRHPVRFGFLVGALEETRAFNNWRRRNAPKVRELNRRRSAFAPRRNY